MRPVCSSFFTATTESGPSCSSEPLPTFGLDIVIVVGQLRLAQHQTLDEVHHTLCQRLAPFGVTISRREVLYLFGAYALLLRAGATVTEDAQWREQVQANGGLIISIDGIRPDVSNETIYL